VLTLCGRACVIAGLSDATMAGMSDVMSHGPDHGPDSSVGPDETVELHKEASTMALYVAICLLAALSAVSEHADSGQIDAFKIVWGTTIGLALAHWLAFRVSARLVASGTIRRHDATAAGAQLAGALTVAVLATVPMLLLDQSVEFDVVRLVLAAFIAGVGYAVARNSGATVRRSVTYAVSLLVVATAVAIVKNALSGH
jgi:hypothetical protein